MGTTLIRGIIILGEINFKLGLVLLLLNIVAN